MSHQGTVGWAYGTHLVPAGDAAARVYATSAAFLRERPRSTAATVGVIPSGAVVATTGVMSGEWQSVRCAGTWGWAYGPQLRTLTEAPTTRFHQPFTAGDASSVYHVYADGLDLEKPVGLAWFFDGDYFSADRSRVLRPDGTEMRGIAAEANRRNCVPVAVVTPAPYETGYGYTWWRNRPRNGAWHRQLNAHLRGRFPFISAARQWMIGYSGGAEFISMHLMAERQFEVWRGAGATIVGGGTPPASVDSTSPSFRRVQATWHVNGGDVAGETIPPTWSALSAATAGERRYREGSSYLRTRLNVYPTGGHAGDDFRALLAADLDRAGWGRLR